MNFKKERMMKKILLFFALAMFAVIGRSQNSSNPYQAYLDTQENYEFYVPPQLETYLSLEMALEDHVRAQLALGRKNYLDAGETGLEQISRERFQIFREIMER